MAWPGRGRRVDQNNRDLEIGLLQRVAERDVAAFRDLVDILLPMVLSVGRRMLGDDSEADDVAQEAMLRLWDHAGTLDTSGGGARAWLRRVTSNLCIDRIRARSRYDVEAEVPEQAERETQLTGLMDKDLAGRVDAAMQGLPDRQRMALAMFHYEGMSQIEIGEALGVSDEAVESLLARGRRRLRSVLEEDWRQLLQDE